MQRRTLFAGIAAAMAARPALAQGWAPDRQEETGQKAGFSLRQRREGYSTSLAKSASRERSPPTAALSIVASGAPATT